MPKTAILIPYRQGDVWRVRAAEFVMPWYKEIGQLCWANNDGPRFNRSAALNRAAQMFCADEPVLPDVYLIADADTFVMHDQVRLAIDTAHRMQMLTMAFTSWHGLNEAGSRLVYSGKLPGVDWSRNDWRRYAPESVNMGVSSCLAVPRSLFEEVGGFDERFIGWGYEDHAFYEACRTFGGGSLRVPGEAWHLWHPIVAERSRAIQPTSANRMLVERYRKASGDRDAMAELIKERA